MSRRLRAVIALTLATALGAAGAITATTTMPAAGAPAPATEATRTVAEAVAFDRFVGEVEVVRGPAGLSADGSTLVGHVFEDRNANSRMDRRERGIAGVRVSNGRDIVTTDERGRYELPVFDNMTVTVTQPAGYQVPVDENNIAQFHYDHLPAGTPGDTRFGGLEPTGPLPSAVNFPLMKSAASAAKEQSCVIAGDLQTYSLREVAYARDGALKDISDRGPLSACGALFLGDVAGDDLGIYPQMKDAVGLIDGPVRFLPGNHDLDFDATDPAHSFDTFRREMGPAYFSYDVGDTHVIALNTVRYPCDETDDADGNRPQCADPENPSYNGRIDDDQMAWLKADIEATPEDKLIVLTSHIALMNFADMGSHIHQVDQVKEIHEMLAGREAVHLAGHSHSIENMKKGDSYGPWKETFGIEELPFSHIIAGAISGDWYSGDLDAGGLPMAYQRDGGRPGVVTLDIEGNQFKERFSVTGESDDVQMNVGINSPHWREWFTTLDEWRQENPNDDSGATPPLNYNDLGDPNMVTRADLQGGTYVSTNFWMGTTSSTVAVSVNGGDETEATRTQAARGEEQNVGAEYADPVAATHQLSVARTGQESASGQDDTQGYRLYRGSQYGPGPARPGNNLADRMHHMWRYELPADLPLGTHRIEVTATDHYGREFTESRTVTVVDERPESIEFRRDLFPTN